MQPLMKLTSVFSSLLMLLLYATTAHAEISEENILKFLPGTWRQIQKFDKISIRGKNTFLPSGQAVERQTWIQRGSLSKVVITKNTWTVRGNMLTLKAIESNSPLVYAGYTDVFTVISIDERNSVMVGPDGSRLVWVRASTGAEATQLQPGCGDALQAENTTIRIRDELDGMDESYEAQAATRTKELDDLINSYIADGKWQSEARFSFFIFMEFDGEFSQMQIARTKSRNAYVRQRIRFEELVDANAYIEACQHALILPALLSDNLAANNRARETMHSRAKSGAIPVMPPVEQLLQK
jgi:hypothetical protein